jgi:signal transduction histidine kinase
VDLGLYSTADRKRFVDALQQDGAVEGMEMEFRAKHGRRIPTLMFARLLKTGDRPLVLTVVTDLTEQKKLEAHLRQARKLEALGRLAGGIAHDFNNLLMAIQGNASLLVESYRDTEPRQTELENIQHAVQSGAKLVLQLLGFASAGTWNTETVDLKALVARTTEMFARTRKQIQISESYPTTPCVAEVDGEQIEQVILNLLINAAQAMQEGGKIEISLNETNLDASFVKPFDVAPARYVAIAIKDHGPGMDPATQQKVFEPFFTTKRPGGGTGLGLASAYGVVKRHGGFITVQSRPKSGSVFTVYLPASEGEPTAKSLPTELIKGHGETVLVVDDEAIIRRTTHAMLDGLGYRVLEANGGRQALEVLKNPPAPVDVVILDMIMPGMDGRQTAHRLKKRYPEIKVLISSGFSTALTARPNGATTDKPQHWDAVIAKPFTLSRLSQKLAALLDGTNHRD